jgi:dynein heavy chain
LVQIFTEFQAALSQFTKVKYDVLDLGIVRDYNKFFVLIEELDRRIATILCQAFDDCSSLYVSFRLIESFGGLVNRPIIQHDFESKYIYLLENFGTDIDEVHDIFVQYKHDRP